MKEEKGLSLHKILRKLYRLIPSTEPVKAGMLVICAKIWFKRGTREKMSRDKNVEGQAKSNWPEGGLRINLEKTTSSRES